MLIIMWAKQKGFTIVELLIVIVVIGILAAISLIAYNGIQNRSENTKTTQAVAHYAKIISSYAVSNNVYPSSVAPPTAPPSDFWACLPYSATTCGSSSNTPSSCFGLNTTPMNQTFIAELKTITPTLPEVSLKPSDCSATQTFQGALVRVYNSGKSLDIHFPQIGDVSCPSIGATTSSTKTLSMNTTRCRVTLPDL
jgi:prepilin-type N-terminal cleavage/methylation domain-containing protein